MVRGDDALDELVAHDVLAAELDEREVLDALEDVAHLLAAPTCPSGRSICVTSPVTTTLLPKPRRVRNIFICSGVVFCASSRMTKLSLSVRPRMNASGATSMTPRSMSAADFSASIMSNSAS